MTSFFRSYFEKISSRLENVNASELEAIAGQLRRVADEGGKVIVVGNGGSAAMASHVSVDLTKVGRVRAINFNEADLLTCFSNDFGYENWVSRALDYYADKSDAVILISSRGESNNIINGALTARSMNLPVITLSGFGPDNRLRSMGDFNLWSDSEEYNVVEMVHHVWLLSVVDFLAQNDK